VPARARAGKRLPGRKATEGTLMGKLHSGTSIGRRRP
jgi:hypothetical protein